MIQDAIDREVEAVDSGKNSGSFCYFMIKLSKKKVCAKAKSIDNIL